MNRHNIFFAMAVLVWVGAMVTPAATQQPVTPPSAIQVNSPIVTINNPTSAKATFVAPVVAGPQNLSFSLIVGGQGSNIPQSATASLLVPLSSVFEAFPRAVIPHRRSLGNHARELQHVVKLPRKDE